MKVTVIPMRNAMTICFVDQTIVQIFSDFYLQSTAVNQKVIEYYLLRLGHFLYNSDFSPNYWQNHVQSIIAMMAFRSTLRQKHYKILMYKYMDTMSYSQMMLMVDLISKWVLMAFGGMELIFGGLGMILIVIL